MTRGPLIIFHLGGRGGGGGGATVAEWERVEHDFAFVEAPVTVAGSTEEGGGSAIVAGGHELTATVDGIAAHASCMVFPALCVPYDNFVIVALPCGTIGEREIFILVWFRPHAFFSFSSPDVREEMDG